MIESVNVKSHLFQYGLSFPNWFSFVCHYISHRFLYKIAVLRICYCGETLHN